MPVSNIAHTYDLLVDLFNNILFVQGYAHVNSTPFLPASGAYVFRPLFPEALPVSILRRM